MEDSKPAYEEIEKELNEYKGLLWQLSDEYKLNLGAAEKELAELKEKFKNLEKDKSSETEIQPNSDTFISQLGLPACILDNQGNVLKYNNKFKFLIELMSFEIEDINNISFLLSKDTSRMLVSKYENFRKNDDGLFQSLYKVKNAFQGVINILLRIYRHKEKSESLALFIELHQLEIQDLTGSTTKTKSIEQSDKELDNEIETENIISKTEIAVFAEKYEVYSEILKLFNNKIHKQFEIKPDTIEKEIIHVFALEISRSRLIDKLNTQYKKFVQQFNEKYPDLTSNEEKHCMLIKAGLTYKEIAALMDISINGVKIARNRLRKKLNLENDTKTSEFIARF